ncbi:hypothetical protein NX801_12650 [Streptomyces sp. LP05-1]|uniref:Uncharacterized protein n=1 Tax=Streptomyces pyxinae TaxID=2970734 RepID=A0ABT2CHA7_9ACTN|nr:hypothetical protein [Streptomyces sp. LP05-1]MCS0636497.1 hypothetical protein [Streptomyces sp. LP05-1]
MTDLTRGVGALRKFQQHVDDLLTRLESGHAGSGQVARQAVDRAAFGTGLHFAEADGFHAQYQRVHTELIRLSKSLGEQIELYNIGVHASDVGYDNVEDDTRRRFHTILVRQAREAEQYEHKDEPKRPREGTKSGTTDMG